MPIFEAGDIMVFEEIDDLVVVEAEHFAQQLHIEKRWWYIITAKQESKITPDGDDNHANSARGQKTDF